MPLVYNVYGGYVPKDSVFIGRGSLYGNQFEIGKHGTRSEVIEKYRNWVYTQPELIKSIKEELKGKDLVCYCSPRACHGDVILEIANSDNWILDEIVRMSQDEGMYE